MKICWDNLEKLKYNKKSNRWYKGTNGYIYMDSCEFCKEPYLTTLSRTKKFCSSYCCNNKNKRFGNKDRLKHGLCESPTYQSWQHMKQRCLNQKNHAYLNYGGRGIKICERWMDFENFYEDMKERPEGTSLDRIDNEGDYEPQNCRWATMEEQSQNRNNNKLSREQIIEIKNLISENNLSQKQIGDIYRVNSTTISYIKNNKIWRNI